MVDDCESVFEKSGGAFLEVCCFSVVVEGEDLELDFFWSWNSEEWSLLWAGG